MTYVQYRDEDFSIPGPLEAYQGIIGPLLHVEEGDKIEIVFRNRASLRVSVHFRGLVPIDEESSPTMSHLSGIGAGEVAVQRWFVPPEAGPSQTRLSCINRIYQSEASPVADMFSGLIGTYVVCRKGYLQHREKRTDVQREFPLLFLIFDETQSHFWEENRKNIFGIPEDDEDSEDIQKSVKFYTINGRLAGNLGPMEMYIGDRVAWYTFGMGNEQDFHTTHWHGHVFSSLGSDTVGLHDVDELLPGVASTLEMTADSEGVWMLHCHVGEHSMRGMSMLYTVLKVPGTSSSGVKMQSAMDHCMRSYRYCWNKRDVCASDGTMYTACAFTRKSCKAGNLRITCTVRSDLVGKSIKHPANASGCAQLCKRA